FSEKAGEFFLTLLQNVRCGEKDLGPFGWRNQRPFLKCRFSSIDCPVDILLCCRGDTLDEFSGGGIPNLSRPAVGSIAVFSGNNHLSHNDSQYNAFPSSQRRGLKFIHFWIGMLLIIDIPIRCSILSARHPYGGQYGRHSTRRLT